MCKVMRAAFFPNDEHSNKNRMVIKIFKNSF